VSSLYFEYPKNITNYSPFLSHLNRLWNGRGGPSNEVTFLPFLCHLNSLQDGKGGESKEVMIQGQVDKKEIFPQCIEWSGPKGLDKFLPTNMQQSTGR
jgi:hypothetical protein